MRAPGPVTGERLGLVLVFETPLNSLRSLPENRMETRPPGFSRSDFTPADIERTKARIFAVQSRLGAQLSKGLVAEPPRWLTRLICAYIAVHTLAGLALLICAVVAAIRFLPLIHRISELAGVN